MLGTTVFILFIMLVAAANICLGFAVAVALGVGPQSWPLAAATGAVADPEHGHGPEHAHAAHSHTEQHAPSLTEHAAPAPSVEEPQWDAVPHASAPPAATAEQVEPTPQIKLSVTDDLEPSAPPEVTLESALTQFARGFDLFEAELTDWNQRRRDAEADIDQLTNSAIDLHSLAASYLDHFQVSLSALDSMVAESAQTQNQRAALRQAGEALATQLRTTVAELGSLQFEPGNVQEASERLDQALPGILQSLHAICRELEEPVAILVRSETELGALATALIEHSQTSLMGRLCFEHLWEISGSTGSLAMFDIDHLRELQREHGAMVVRRLLQSLGETAQGLVPIGTPIARLSGKQFAICLPDTSPDDAVEVLENIRQQIAHTRFTHGDQPLTVSVSCAVVIAQAGETGSDALQRLRTAIRAAKDGGRNCTYLCEHEQPTLVPATSLSVSSLAVAL